jgi:hypothetical protein
MAWRMAIVLSGVARGKLVFSLARTIADEAVVFQITSLNQLFLNDYFLGCQKIRDSDRQAR